MKTRKPYPTDFSDAQWNILEPFISEPEHTEIMPFWGQFGYLSVSRVFNSTVVFWLVADGFWFGLEVHEAQLTYYGFPTTGSSGGRRVD